MAERILFSEYWYDLAAVRSAAEAYGSLAVFDIVRDATGIAVTVSEIDPDGPPDMLDEFCNHALLETVTLWRTAAPSTAAVGGP